MEGALTGLTSVIHVAGSFAATNDHFAILVVDEDPDARDNMADILTDRGYRVSLAGDGVTALARLDEHDYQVVLVELALRGMDGLSLCADLTRRRPSMATLLIAGHGDAVSTEAVRAAGIRQIFRKPLDVRRLLAAIESALVC